MRPLPIAACLAFTLATTVALAQDPGGADTGTVAAVSPATTEQAPPNATGDIERGRQLAYTCLGCHGVPGYENAYPSYRVPKIGGQTEVYLVNALTAYGNGSRAHPTMQAQAESFSETDIADIAAFLSSVQP